MDVRIVVLVAQMIVTAAMLSTCVYFVYLDVVEQRHRFMGKPLPDGFDAKVRRTIMVAIGLMIATGVLILAH